MPIDVQANDRAWVKQRCVHTHVLVPRMDHGVKSDPSIVCLFRINVRCDWVEAFTFVRYAEVPSNLNPSLPGPVYPREVKPHDNMCQKLHWITLFTILWPCIEKLVNSHDIRQMNGSGASILQKMNNVSTLWTPIRK